MGKKLPILKFFLNRVIFHGSTLFTVLMLFLTIDDYTVTSSKILKLMLYAFLITLGNLVLYIKKIQFYLRIAIHFALSTGILLVILYSSGYMATSSKWAVLLVGYVIIYAIVSTVVILVHASKARKKKEEKNYKKIY